MRRELLLVVLLFCSSSFLTAVKAQDSTVIFAEDFGDYPVWDGLASK